MSLTLGEKLRQAREERGMSISEVAEQTRISPLYLESIENNDYRPLPGGIFNKGFVKSYAKTLGLDEQEALQDYATLLSQQGSDANEDPKTYRPEVLTDEGSRWGLFPTLIFSAIILFVIVWGVMAFLSYYNSESTPTVANVNTNKNANVTSTPTPTPTPSISITEAKIQVKPINAAVWVSTTVDGKKTAGIIKSDDTKTYEPKESFKLSYANAQAQNIQMTINGKQIKLPDAPPNSKGGTIDISVTKENVNQIYQSGEIPSGP